MFATYIPGDSLLHRLPAGLKILLVCVLILAATLLAIAVTAVVLGLPLGFSALKLVEDVSRSDMSSRAQQIATLLDEQVATHRPLDLGDARILVPQGNQLVVRTPEESHTFGGEVGEQPIMTIDGAETFPTDSQLDFSTVYVVGGPGSSPRVLETMISWADPGMAVVPLEVPSRPENARYLATKQTRMHHTLHLAC